MAGRKPLTELERMRRAALRRSIALQALKDEMQELGDNLPEILAIETPGRRPLARSEIIKRDAAILNELLFEIKLIEKELGEKHLKISAATIDDPLVRRGTVYEVGRKKNSDLDYIDKQLRAEFAGFQKTKEELIKNKYYDVINLDIVLSANGKQMGRKPKTFSERVVEYKEKITDMMQQIFAAHKAMTALELIDRQIKLYRDFERVKKMRAKSGENVSKVKSYFIEIETLLLKKKQIERDIVSGNLTHNTIEKIVINNPFDAEFDEIIREIKVLKIKILK